MVCGTSGMKWICQVLPIHSSIIFSTVANDDCTKYFLSAYRMIYHEIPGSFKLFFFCMTKWVSLLICCIPLLYSCILLTPYCWFLDVILEYVEKTNMNVFSNTIDTYFNNLPSLDKAPISSATSTRHWRFMMLVFKLLPIELSFQLHNL